MNGTQREFIFGTTKETGAGVDGSARTCIIDESSSDNVIQVALTQLALGSGLVACIHVENKEFLATEQTSRVFKRFSGQSTFVRETCVVIIANKYWRKGGAISDRLGIFLAMSFGELSCAILFAPEGSTMGDDISHRAAANHRN